MKKSSMLIGFLLGLVLPWSPLKSDTMEAPAPQEVAPNYETNAPLRDAESWLDYAVTPVTNPVWFEDARVTSEVRPIMIYHLIDNDFITQGGEIRIWALQARYAITDKLALIAVKDGLVEFEPEAGTDERGFADVAAGLKYQAFRDDEMQLLITPGLTFEIPIGSRHVFQGNGDGMAQPFVSVLKGFDKFQMAGNLGMHIPFDYNEETAQLHYSLHAHYELCKYFIPLVEVNGFTVLTEADVLEKLDSEGMDVINFGAGDAEGETFVTVGVGFRSKFTKNTEFGFAWEKLVTGQDTIFDHRFTADVIYRF